MNMNSILKKEGTHYSPFAAFLLFVCLSVISLQTYAQNESSLTLQVKDQNVEQVFTQITKQIGIKFFYDHETIRQEPPVSLNLSKAPLSEALNAISQQTQLALSVRGNTVLVSSKTKQKQTETKKEPISVKGKVSASSGEAIIGASIQVKGTATGTITDMDGNFSLQAEEGQVLTISYIGYESVQVKAGRKPLNITMK